MISYGLRKRYLHRLKQAAPSLVFAGFGIAAFAVMRYVLNGNTDKVLWYDYLLTLKFARNPSLADAINHAVSTDGNGVLYATLMWIWYRFMPYGVDKLLILSELFSALTVFAIGLAGKKIGGFKCGLWCGAMALGSCVLLRYGAELRSYSLVLLSAAVLLHIYPDFDSSPSRSRTVIFGAAMALIVYAQIFSAVFCFGFFLLDAVKAKRNKSFKRIWAYIIAVALYAPYAILFFTNPEHMTPGAGNPHSASNLLSMVKVLLDGNMFFLGIVMVSALLLVFSHISARRIGGELSKQARSLGSAAWVSLFSIQAMFAITFVFERFTEGGFTYLYRYVIYALPGLLILAGYALNLLCELVDEAMQKTLPSAQNAKISSALLITFILLLVPYSAAQAKQTPLELNGNDPTFEARCLHNTAKWVQGADLYAPGTALYNNIWYDRPADAIEQWFEYMVGEDGRRDLPNALYALDETALNYDTVVTVEPSPWWLTPEQEEFLNAHYYTGSEQLIDPDTLIKYWYRK
jgi:hypothetical protein